jgi:C_GCAxxG_C_C family probable redox protein
MNEKVTQACEYFKNGSGCAQAVLGAFCEEYGLPQETALKIACGLNSGARCAEICGAVSGAVLVIGLKYGDSKKECNLRTEEFIRRFKEKNGDVVCRNLLGCDITTPDGRAKAARENLFKTLCPGFVASAAEILCDLGY